MAYNVTLLRALMGSRGIYSRVAKKLQVDPSYVSRVARGERRSPEIEKALTMELKKIQAGIPKGRSRRSGSNQ
jgi:transcriptional regulator with XRE-family HTH domain